MSRIVSTLEALQDAISRVPKIGGAGAIYEKELLAVLSDAMTTIKWLTDEGPAITEPKPGFRYEYGVQHNDKNAAVEPAPPYRITGQKLMRRLVSEWEESKMNNPYQTNHQQATVEGGRGMSELDIDAIKARLAAATPGPLGFATAPAEGSSESPAEYVANALTGDGELYVVWDTSTEGNPEGYTLTAVTGDGPRASANAKLYAHAPSDLAALIREVEELRAERDGVASTTMTTSRGEQNE